MNKLALGIVSGIFAAVMLTTPTFAWAFFVKGAGQCQKSDGSYKITWVIDNTNLYEPLKIDYSSNPQLIAAGAQVPTNHKLTLTQVVDGKKPANYDLTIAGHWDSDPKIRELTAHADLCKACKQPPVVPPVTPPVTPPSGGQGGGTPVEKPVVTPAAVTTPQVVVPAGAVNAGNGGAPKVLSLASIAGLIGSVSALGFGIRGLKKQA